MNALPRNVHILFDDIAAVTLALVLQCCDNSRSNTHVRVKHAVTLISQRKNKTFNKFNRKLARVNSLLHVVILYVRENPDISRVFPQWVAGKLASFRTFIVALVRIF